MVSIRNCYHKPAISLRFGVIRHRQICPCAVSLHVIIWVGVIPLGVSQPLECVPSNGVEASGGYVRSHLKKWVWGLQSEFRRTTQRNPVSTPPFPPKISSVWSGSWFWFRFNLHTWQHWNYECVFCMMVLRLIHEEVCTSALLTNGIGIVWLYHAPFIHQFMSIHS